jgi:hypothetical protein
MPAPVLDGVLCRILLYTSLAFSTPNLITVELSTPRFVAPHGVAFCLNSSAFAQTPGSVSVASVQRGGSVWAQTEKEQIASDAPWNKSAFFMGSYSWGLEPLKARAVGCGLWSPSRARGAQIHRAQRRVDGHMRHSAGSAREGPLTAPGAGSPGASSPDVPSPPGHPCRC